MDKLDQLVQRDYIVLETGAIYFTEGNGILTITKDTYIYEGTVDGEVKTLTFKVTSIPSLPSDIGRNVQIYEGNQIYQFEMDIKWLPTKMVHVGEYFFELIHKDSSDRNG